MNEEKQNYLDLINKTATLKRATVALDDGPERAEILNRINDVLDDLESMARYITP